MCTPCVPGIEAAEVTGYLGNQSAGGCKLPWECWALNPDLPLEEQLFLITEPSLQVHAKFIYLFIY